MRAQRNDRAEEALQVIALFPASPFGRPVRLARPSSVGWAFGEPAKPQRLTGRPLRSSERLRITLNIPHYTMLEPGGTVNQILTRQN